MNKILKTGEAIQRSGIKLTTFIPIRIRKRGGRRVIVAPCGNTGSTSDAQRTAHHDTPMLTALARAFHWKRLLDEGVVKSGTEIARREGLHPSTVNEALRLTLLSPEIVQQILAGQQPKTLSLIWFQRNALPSDWEVQRSLLNGFDA
jgi:hypothetical protein